MRIEFCGLRWNLVAQFLRFRKSVFMDGMRWPLFHHDGMEFEQYDNVPTVYVVAHEDGQVRGGARLVRSDASFGRGRYVYSYMIRDAWRGATFRDCRSNCAKRSLPWILGFGS